jgi:hypothetical protein
MTEEEAIKKWVQIYGIEKQNKLNLRATVYFLRPLVERFAGRPITAEALIKTLTLLGFTQGAGNVSFNLKLTKSAEQESLKWQGGRIQLR